MKLKKGSIALLTLAGMFYMSVQKADACTRAVYIGPDHMVVTGRTMDWKEDIMSNIYVFPRGIQRAGYNKENAVKWTSKYGSVIATGYDIGTCDGMNEKGLVASLLFLPESVFDRPGDTRPVMGISIWTQYVLDNFATVHIIRKTKCSPLFKRSDISYKTKRPPKNNFPKYSRGSKKSTGKFCFSQCFFL